VLRQRCYAVLAAATVFLGFGFAGGIVPASSHFAYFTGDTTEDIYIPTNEDRTVAGNHSYTFVSAQDLEGGDSVCPRLYSVWSTAQWQGTCGQGLVRYCPPHRRHGSDLDCHDEDDTISQAGAAQASSNSMVRVHAAY